MAFGAIQLHAGDFKKGKESQFAGGKLIMKHEGKFLRENIPGTEIDTLEIASEESVHRIGGSIGWGIAGAALLGPVGLLAGVLAGGKGDDVTFVCKLKDGRKFLATATKKVYTEMSAFLFE